jgi:hypothetical protein
MMSQRILRTHDVHTMVNRSIKKILAMSMLLLSCQYAWAQANAGKDRAFCGYGTVEIGTDTDPSWCYYWENDKGNKSFPNTPKITVEPTETTTYTLTVTGPDFSFKDTDEVTIAVVKSIALKKVTFSNDIVMRKDMGIDYPKDQWQEGLPPAPVCYKGGDMMQLSAEFMLDGSLTDEIKVQLKGTGTNGFNIDPDEAIVFGSGEYVNLLPSNVVKAFGHRVDFFDPFEMTWEISFDDGASWCAAGKSANPLYCTWKAPVDVEAFHTVVHLSCKNAKGQADEDAIFSSIWSEFADRNVSTIQGKQLTYYQDWDASSTTTGYLLANGDGESSAWTEFFLDMLKIQGIQHQDWYVVATNIRNKSYGGIFIKNVTFATHGDSPTYLYVNIKVDGEDVVRGNSFNWRYAQVNDAAGIPGQGTANPLSFFQNHQFLRFNGKYYDPSYGLEAATLNEVEDNIIGVMYSYETITINESDINMDLNHDGDKDDSPLMNAFVLQQNRPGPDLELEFKSY